MRRALMVCVLGCMVGCGDPPAPAAMTDAGPPDMSAQDAGSLCTRDEDCDDGRFCNGSEDCAPASLAADARGCAPSTIAVCLAGQTCDEAADTCTTTCSVSEDADGDGARAAACGGDDCDDADAARFPGNAEICDPRGVDEDCDVTTFGTRDLDGDGHVDALCCNGARCGEDCDDLRRGSNPDVPEVCDGLDNDCDGDVDEGVRVPVWPDRDFDLHGDADAAPEMRCVGAFGFATLADDCDDAQPSIHPAQVEICDGQDNDCDRVVDESPAAVTWYADADGDGFGNSDPATTRVSCVPLPGYVLRATDCDDARAGVSPATPEVCDGLDNDCNGRPDFLLGARDTEDDDLDGHADLACPSGDDCDDRDPTTSPDAREICDARDNDCNGMVDDGAADGQWWIDRDGDTFGDEGTPTVNACTFVRGRVTRGGDCDDSSTERRPGATEVCDGSDDDCDGTVDEGSVREPYYLDRDGDGLGAGEPVLACVAPLDRVPDATDCDDTSRGVGGARLWFADVDGDGWGDSARATLSCTPIADRIARGGDCDDARADVRPMGTEVCGGGDEDCDGEVDEDPSASAGCTIAGATGACVAGACTIAMCTAGAGDCNGDRSDGCETDLTTTATSCGACGRACGAGERCRDGECARIVGVAAGRSHLCALLDTGRVSCWGNNDQGQLGRAVLGGQAGPARDPSEYVQIFTGATLEGAVAIAAHPRANFTCAVLATGQVACWGDNEFSQCGGNALVRQVSRAVYVPELSDAVALDVGVGHACAVRATGGVACWGNNAQRQLGLGTPAMGTMEPASSGTPRPMVELEGGAEQPIADAIQVVANDYFTCVLHAGGTRVSCAGQNGTGGGWGGQLGRPGLPNANYGTADDVALPAGAVITKLVGGAGQLYEGFTCAVRSAGAPLCWGINDGEALGPFASFGGGFATPTPIEPLLFAETRDVFAGPGRLCVAYVNASFGPRVGCLGQTPNGELALGPTTSTSVPFDMQTTVATGPGAYVRDEVRELVLGGNFTCALLTSGALSCFGADLASAHGGSRRVADFSVTVANVP